ncbi:bifunctional metallophosphatase/5'-nucleotidase [Salegentibacter chungangensis]|uniref:Bifunctional metallophosphatase/5'-nucleotidase n=1 Tax=Salegentibacter chungangensis TaxID=1335724 RepID=A0ABW3NTZ3_9FLAO
MKFIKFTLPIYAVLALSLSGCNFSKNSSSDQKSAEDESVTISVLHTNDIHGSYMPFTTTLDNSTAQTGDETDVLVRFDREGIIGGMPRMAQAVKSIRSQKGEESVILLDGGDTFSDDQLSNLTKGETVIRLMNQLKYDMMVLGNHDFDYGLERTRQLNEMANFPMRAANIIDESTGEPIFNEAYTILERKGLKIAILPVGYRNTPLTGNPKNIEGLRFEKGVEIIQKYLPELKSKSDVIIVLSHEGMAVDKTIAEKVEGIDLIIGAHSHDVITPPVKINGTFVVQALSDGAVLGETELIIKDKDLSGINTNYHFLWNEDFDKDAEAEKLVQELRKPHLSKLEEQITTTDTIIGRQYKSESPFDKMVTTLMMENFNADASFLPGVGYGISLKGDITSEDIYKLLPHPAKIVTLKMTGEQIKTTLEQTATNLKPKNKTNIVGGLIQSSGINYKIDITKPLGQRVTDIMINGRELEMTHNYKVATHSGMLNGIHNYEEFGKGMDIEKTDIVLTEFVIQNLRDIKKLPFPKKMGEVKLTK